MMNLLKPRVFSGIQPSGIPHIGNYFGSLRQWIQLANEKCVRQPSDQKPAPCDSPIFCIVDIHAYASQNASFGQKFHENILSTTASLLALGLNNHNCSLFRQSDVLEHSYLHNVLNSFVSTQRLSHMIQFKEKTRYKKGNKSVTNALLNYPVLQAADILLYHAKYVPIGADQVQHIELTRDIAKKFNIVTGSGFFPEPEPLFGDLKDSRRIKSLRDPSRKMSKSDVDNKSFIGIVDEPDVVIEKVKKAITDCNSRVYYDMNERPAVSNLMLIHHLLTGESFDQIRDDCHNIETAEYKLRLAAIIIEHFRPVRDEYKRLRSDHGYLESVLEIGCMKVSPIAKDVVQNVKQLLGSTRN